ncbi:hypothetical protein FISHEDRAFT_39344, partial [Fistulina hepatica ATCC 64428]
CDLFPDGVSYDLTPLAGEHKVSRERDTPPSTMVDELRFDICDTLGTQSGVDESDQCPSGARACLTKVNKKANQDDRIVAVIPVAQTSVLKPSYSSLSSSRGLNLILHGATYPSSGGTEQSLSIALTCSTETHDPTFVSYDGSEMRVDWSVPAACATQDDDTPSDDEAPPAKTKVGNGLGVFFLLLVIAVVLYFTGGAYYNYSTYGARGADLIPHRDFWREVPYMFQDLISHLCSSARPRHSSSRGGYIAV